MREPLPQKENLSCHDPVSLPVFALIILFSSVANAFGWITM